MRNRIMPLITVAAMALGIQAAQISAAASEMEQPDRFQRKGKGRNNRRGRGAVTPPKKRSNRLTISKRVRRAHRKAAR